MTYFKRNSRFNQRIKPYYTLREVVDFIYCKTHRYPKAYGKGYMLLCPAHRDINPSLSIGEGNNGAILMRCFKGCDIQDICAAIGIPISSLFPPKKRE